MSLFGSINYKLSTPLSQSEIYAVLSEKTAALSEAVWRFSRKKLFIGKVNDGELNIVYRGLSGAVSFVGKYNDGSVEFREIITKKYKLGQIFNLCSILVLFVIIGFLYATNKEITLFVYISLLNFLVIILQLFYLKRDKRRAVKKLAELLNAKVVSNEKV